MAGYTVFTDIEKTFTAPIDAFASDKSTAISAALATPFRAALLLYVAWYDILLLRGSIREPVTDVATRLFKVFVVVTLVTSATDYNFYVVHFFRDVVPAEINAALGLKSADTSSFDGMLNSVGELADRVWKDAGMLSKFKAGLAILLMYVVIGAVMAHGFFIAIFAKYGLGLMLGLGPIFIALGLFESTRRWAEAWLSVVLNFVILNLLSVAVLALMMTTMELQFSNSDYGGDIGSRPFGVVVCAMFCWGVVSQLPALAATLSGGGIYHTTANNPVSFRNLQQRSAPLLDRLRGAQAAPGRVPGPSPARSSAEPRSHDVAQQAAQQQMTGR